jgi:hypothetical protein
MAAAPAAPPRGRKPAPLTAHPSGPAAGLQSEARLSIAYGSPPVSSSGGCSGAIRRRGRHGGVSGRIGGVGGALIIVDPRPGITVLAHRDPDRATHIGRSWDEVALRQVRFARD